MILEVVTRADFYTEQLVILNTDLIYGVGHKLDLIITNVRAEGLSLVDMVAHVLGVDRVFALDQTIVFRATLVVVILLSVHGTDFVSPERIVGDFFHESEGGNEEVGFERIARGAFAVDNIVCGVLIDVPGGIDDFRDG